jgi:hypothetical protein
MGMKTMLRSVSRAAVVAPMSAAVLAAVLAALVGQPALAAGTPEQQCEGGKNGAAGKLAACIAKAQKTLVASADAIAYDEAVTKCEAKLASSFSKLEAGAACPSTGDATAVRDFVGGCRECIGDALAGGSLCLDPVTCANNLVSCDASLDGCNADLATCADDLAICEADLGVIESDLAVCEGDLDTCLLAEPRLHKTGQTTCYNDAGALIACAGSGRDGEFQAGNAASFTDNGNGTITDNVTGLMWEKLSDNGDIHDKDNTYASLSAAIARANALNTASFAGHNDWRVPNIRELASLPRYGSYNPAVHPAFNTGCVGGCTVLTCSCTKSNVYASSTVYRGYTQAIWKLSMTDGDQYAGDAVGAHYARAVRTAN